MKKYLIIILFCFQIINLFAFDNKSVHPAIIKKAFELLKVRYIQSGGSEADLMELENSISNGGAIAYGAELEDQCENILDVELKWINGHPVYNPKNYDPIYHYSIPVLAHFWDADKGDDYNHYFTCGDIVSTPIYHNAWQKSREYLSYLNVDNYNNDKNKSYQYLGRLLHLFADMGVPAHTQIDPHTGGITSEICKEWKDDLYESYFIENSNYYTILNENTDKTEFLDLNGDGGFLYNTPNISSVSLMKFLFYTMNQLSNFFPSNNISGNINLNQGTNEIITNHYSKFGLCSNYKSSSPKTIAENLTPFLISATANILYWYCLQTNQIHPIKSLTLDKNYSKYNQELFLPNTIKFKPGFKFSALESNKMFSAKIGNYPKETLKSNDEIFNNYFVDLNDSLVNTNQGKNVHNDYSEITLYPNPVKNNVIIELGNNKSLISIIDNYGKIVYKKETIANCELIDVSNFPKGSYTVTIKQFTNLIYKNIIVQ